MSFKDCLNNLRANNQISPEEAVEMEHRYDLLARTQRPGGISAKDQIVAELEAEARERKRRFVLTEARRQELMTAIFGFRDVRGRANPAEALIWLIENNGMGVEDVAARIKGIQSTVGRKLEGLLYEFRRGAFAGDKRRLTGETYARLENVLREIFGEDTGDALAKELAVAWMALADDLRQRFNAAGGAIGKLRYGYMPQLHNQEALLTATFAEWYQFILPRLDRERMVNPLTGLKIGDDEMAVALLDVFNKIRTDGWLERDPAGAAFGKGALFRQHADHRFLHFKDAKSWLEYQRQFGEGDPFAAMMGHLDVMARDIAFMEILGPNPDLMFKYLEAEIRKNAEMASAGLADPSTHPIADIGYVNGKLKRAEEMFAIGRGAANTPVNAKWANRIAGFRNIISAASLGQAAISSISDFGTQQVTRAFAGMPASSQFAMFGEYITHFTTAGRRYAVESGLILDSAHDVMHQQARYLGSISGRSLTAYINERMLTFTGMIPFTQGGKHAFGSAMQKSLADEVGHTLSQMNPLMREVLERNNITAADWDKIRRARLDEPRPGVRFLRPNEIEQSAGLEMSEKYMRMILRMRGRAVVEPIWRSRAAILSESRPGNTQGELLRSMAQFKSFPVAFAMLHGGQVFRDISGGMYARGAAYAGGLLILSTMYGALSLQLKQIGSGKDPRPMNTAKFWEAALLQGGGLGIYGDFLFSELNRFGGGFDRTVAGPMVDRLNTIWNLSGGNLAQLLHGEKTHFGRELVKGVGQMVPGSSAWFLRAAWERMVLNQLQYLADPEAHSAFRRQIMSARKDFKQDFWYQPGQAKPDRGPDWGNVWRQ